MSDKKEMPKEIWVDLTKPRSRIANFNFKKFTSYFCGDMEQANMTRYILADNAEEEKPTQSKQRVYNNKPDEVEGE